ncbi:MAG TPA: hypothetical protein VN961_15010, partial [Streptosporangiaceae bacterium]|nr:hypothetical protein [Streptosporangiaceae bacterium]
MGRRSGRRWTGATPACPAAHAVMVKVKVLPRPGSLTSVMAPPCISTSRRTMLRPRPVPPCRRVLL